VRDSTTGQVDADDAADALEDKAVDKIDGEDVEEHMDEKLKEKPICTNGLSSTGAWNPKEKMIPCALRAQYCGYPAALVSMIGSPMGMSG